MVKFPTPEEYEAFERMQAERHAHDVWHIENGYTYDRKQGKWIKRHSWPVVATITLAIIIALAVFFGPLIVRTMT